MKIVYRFLDMPAIVAFALATLKERSPVGKAPADKHPGLYRDSHLVFLNGHVVNDVGAFKVGDQINISNPVPYARKIEAGAGKMSVPGHVYEETVQLVAARFGNQAIIKMTFMPVRFGSIQAFAQSASGKALARRVRKGRVDLHSEWLVRQPSIEIKAR